MTPYVYHATLARILDADTVSLLVDVGFYVTVCETFRLVGLNAPERFTDEGKVATKFVQDWFARQTGLTILSEKPLKQEKFGRFLATITGSDGTVLNAELLAAGLAVPYMM